MPRTTLAPLAFVLTFALPALAEQGYYRFPTIHADTIVFTAEGDLWRVGSEGGVARRLTTHPDRETDPAFSPDGARVAFSASYDGPPEVYVMPLAGGQPERLTFEGEGARVVGWAASGEVLYATRHFSTLPDTQLAAVDPASRRHRRLPVHQAVDGAVDPDGTLFFTRFRQGSYTKRYRGGTAQSLWRFADGEAEAVPLTADFPGMSHEPMWWNGRVLFAGDRDGTMNLWSMTPAGEDLRQHTHHAGWDVKSPDLHGDRVVYQLGADLHLLDLADGSDRQLEIHLASDFEQRRERWVAEPLDYLTAAHLSPTGDRVVATARGKVFVAPVGQGRFVEASHDDGVRFRGARFLPSSADTDEEPARGDLVVFSDQSGEVELWRLDARGVRPPEQLSEGGTVLRHELFPSPDGARVAFVDHNNELWLLDLESRELTRVAASPYFDFGGVSWSPDSGWLAFAVPTENLLTRIELYRVEDGTTTALTSDRFDSFSPAWSPDGKWIYFLSDRNLESLTRHPWGSYQPGPLLDRTTRVYHVSLKRGERSPFAPANELFPEDEEKEKKEKKDDGDGKDGEDGKKGKRRGKAAEGEEGGEAPETPAVDIDLDGLRERLFEVPLPPGSYSELSVGAKHLFWLAAETSRERRQRLEAVEIGRDKLEVAKLAEDVSGYELSADGKKLLLRKEEALYVIDAGAQPPKKLTESAVSLDGWTFRLDPKLEWRQMLVDAWRLQRDYFYDPGMHGVDWRAMLEKVLPLVERVTDRAELSDLFGELMGELSALHHFVVGGDAREAEHEAEPASLGAVLERDEAAGGYRVVRLYRGDPDLPEERSPLARPGVDVGEDDVLTAINGVATLTVADPALLLRNQAGRQVLLAVKGGSGTAREVVAEPITQRQEAELRYDVWEHQRRLRVEEAGGGEIGYVHLRAMGGGNYSEWARHYFPVFNRQGLIIDVRHNRGGNIDSWILGSLLRRPWMWWKPRTGVVYRNMQFAFGGHMVVLCNERTASDGEAFAEGFRRLGLGKVLGTRTWGGEIWLTASNVLVDRGIATAAEFGVYGPEGEWLIEGHGVEPDIVVDNLPHATFGGADAQLEAAIAHLQERIREDPPVVPEPPPYPDKSFTPPPSEP